MDTTYEMISYVQLILATGWYPVVWLTANITICLALIYLVYDAWRNWHRLPRWNGRRGKMPLQKEQMEAIIIADGITDLLDQLFEKGQISGRARSKWAKRIGHKAGLQDLLPHKKKLGTSLILWLKILSRRRHAALKDQKTLPIPGPIPDQDPKVKKTFRLPKHNAA